MADCTSTYEYVDPHGTYTGTLSCDGVDHGHGLHSGLIGDGYRQVWPMRDGRDLRILIEHALAENGITGNSDGLHSWRCAYPGLYGACTCVEELIDDLVQAVTDHAAE